MKKLLVLAVLAALLSATDLFAECGECNSYVSGTIVGETWTSAGSPYCVEGDILIATLVIEPGVCVEFQGDYVFEVAGVLTAIGTEQDPITFTKDDAVSGWQGIFFNYCSPDSELAYCTVEGSMNSGIRIDNSTPTIRSCTIQNNSSTQGGGINVVGASSFTLDSCEVTGNSLVGSNPRGGGIYVQDCELVLTSCKISNNSISGAYSSYGGGVFVTGGTLTLNGCSINRNSIDITTCSRSLTGYGGGIYVEGTTTISNCVIASNVINTIVTHCGICFSGHSRGGGVYVNGKCTLENCILSCNSVYTYACSTKVKEGGGLYCTGSDESTLTNCTIAENTNQGLRNAGYAVEVSNSIFWKSSSSQISGDATVTYSDVQDGYPGEGNINCNPIFGPCGLRIVPGSCCIDKGNPDPQYNDVCLPPSLGTVRNDMGAHGGPGGCGWPCECDLNCDGRCDMCDWLLFGEDWGRTDCDPKENPCECDLNDDGICDMRDWMCFGWDWGRTNCP